MDIQLQNLGFDSFFEARLREVDADSESVARVIAEHKGLYRIKSPKGEFSAKVTGRHMFEASSREDFPVVGDWVTVDFSTDPAIIRLVLPRKTVLHKSAQSRKTYGKSKIQLIAANIDTALVVESVDRDFSLNRFERYFAIALEGGVDPAIILNKIDLITSEEQSVLIGKIKARFPEVEVILTSTVTTTGLDSLGRFINPGQTYCFLGSSGVGKSSLINALIGRDIAKTREIGQGTGRGKHTTTHREMYFLTDSGIVVDNPGVREVGLADAGEGVTAVFNEIADFTSQCKFPDCTHIHEPGCAVLNALETGQLDEDRYENYVRLSKEAAHYEEAVHEKREREKKFGKHIKKSLEHLDKYQ